MVVALYNGRQLDQWLPHYPMVAKFPTVVTLFKGCQTVQWLSHRLTNGCRPGNELDSSDNKNRLLGIYTRIMICFIGHTGEHIRTYFFETEWSELV